MASKKSESVKVIVRCRPLNATEEANGNYRCAAAARSNRRRGARGARWADARARAPCLQPRRAPRSIVDMDAKTGSVTLNRPASSSEGPKVFSFDKVYDWK